MKKKGNSTTVLKATTPTRLTFYKVVTDENPEGYLTTTSKCPPGASIMEEQWPSSPLLIRWLEENTDGRKGMYQDLYKILDDVAGRYGTVEILRRIADQGGI